MSSFLVVNRPIETNVYLLEIIRFFVFRCNRCKIVVRHQQTQSISLKDGRNDCPAIVGYSELAAAYFHRV